MEGLVSLNFIHYLLLPLLLQISASNARDTITLSHPLKDNQTLVSPAQTFELGFFSPNKSGKYRYLGIWYKLPIQTVIWVANRDNPLNESSGVFKIDSKGNLVLVNQASAIIWSSSVNHSKVENPIAQLLDTGNLVVKSESKEDKPNKDYIWQSFDYPIDSLIAGMKLGWDLKTGFNRKMNSWKSFEDPSPGDFTYEMDLHQGAQLVLRNRSTVLFQSGPWNGARFSGTPEMRNNSVFVPILVNNDEGLYYTFKAAGEVISRLSINPSGLIQRYTWSNKSLQWTVIFTAQIDKCTSYGICGVNGVCNINDIIVCECMKGFEPKSPEDWNKIEWSSGCKRSIPLNCDKGDEFVKFASVKLPDTTNSWVDRSMRTLEECEVKCVENCSCTAYANSDIVGGGSGCILWFEDLIDIRTINLGGQELYVKMAAPELDGNGDSNQKKNRGALIASVSVILGMLALCSAVGFIIWRARRRTGKECNGEKSHHKTENQSDLDLPLVDFDTIAIATGHFSSTNELGQGGFGLVYKGELSSGEEIAVKRLSKNSKQGLDEFKNEVILIAKLQHRNLVKLLGCCIQGEEMMLIYEYMPNKSLDQFIFDQEGSTLLSWQKRFQIINGVAQGVLYLHRDSRLRIIHRDLKASNVLLDNEMNAKISDFGLARTFGGDQTLAQTRRIVGTYGYLSPEYAVHGQFSIKSDVFSFGVLVLEIITGKRNRGFYHPDHDLNLLGHAWKLWTEGRALELVDKAMEYTTSIYEALRCIEVGLLCVQHHPEDRPTMSSVILMLGGDAILPQPKQPGFYHETSLKKGQSSSEKFYYDNKITITTIDGR